MPAGVSPGDRLVWDDWGRGVELTFHVRAWDELLVEIDDASDSGVHLEFEVGTTPVQVWAGEQLALLRAVEAAYPREVVESSPMCFEWAPGLAAPERGHPL